MLFRFMLFFTSMLACYSYPIPTDINIQFSIALHQQNIDILTDTLLDISNPKSINYGKYWSMDKINQLVSPPKQHNQKVVNWLHDNGIKENNIINYGDSIVCSTNIINAGKLLDVTFTPIDLTGKSTYISNINYKIPEDLTDIIEFIEGVSKIYPYPKKQHFSNISNNIVDSGYVSREVVQRLYSIQRDIITTNNISVCSVEYQNSSGFSQSNLLQSQKMNGEQPNPVEETHIIGNDMDSPDTESELDIQMMSQTAENISIWFWGSEKWLFTFANNFFNTKEIPDVLSMSWGWAEDDQCSIANCTNITVSTYIKRVNNEYAKIGLRGVSIAVSSGDAGAPGRTSESCDESRPVNPVFPSSSPWVTSLGATFVVNDPHKTIDYHTPICKNNQCANGDIEIGTNLNYTGWTAGGGFSNENRPKWQDTVVEKYLQSNIGFPAKFNKNGRAYPDISVVGHNCPVYTEGSLMGVDGTSCSSPIFATILSILNQYQVNRGKPKLGFFNQVLYQMYNDDSTIFNDITIGNNWCTEDMCCPTNKNGGSNFGYNATKGYDTVTGLGTPNVSKIMKWLNQHL